MSARASLGRELLGLWLAGLAIAASLLAYDVVRNGREWALFTLLPGPEPTRVQLAVAFAQAVAMQRPLSAIAVVGVPAVLAIATLALCLAAFLRRGTRAAG